MKFNKILNLSKEEIEEIVYKHTPKIYSSRQKYFVKIRDKYYPINQVVAVACNLAPLEVATVQAYNILKKKGFKIETRVF